MRTRGAERAIRILTGLIAIVLALAATTFGVRAANGALRSTYRLEGTFASAGQGLQAKSDVKVHGVNIGHVKSVRLVQGRALVRMDVDSGQKVPVEATATIRPKTLFGDKYVDIDPGPAETTGPFLADHGRIVHTVGSIELERILSEAYPILKAIKPEELTVVLDELAKAGDGEGPAINRQIGNFQQLADVGAAHTADTDQFLRDLATLSDQLDRRAGDIVAGAQDLNVALPPLNQRADELTTVLEQTSRLSADLADVLESNKPFLTKSVTEGGKATTLIADRSREIGPLVLGLRQYLEVQAEVVRVPFGDGTLLAAVKIVLGEDCPAGRSAAGSNSGCAGGAPGLPTQSPPAGASATAPATSAKPAGALPPTPLAGSLSSPLSGVQALQALIGGVR